MLKALIGGAWFAAIFVIGIVQNSHARVSCISCDTNKVYVCPAANRVVSGFDDPNWRIFEGYIGPVAPTWKSVYSHINDATPIPICEYRGSDGKPLLLISKAYFCQGASGNWNSGQCTSGNDVCTFNPQAF